jgi:protein disulfide-isomerase A1
MAKKVRSLLLLVAVVFLFGFINNAAVVSGKPVSAEERRKRSEREYAARVNSAGDVDIEEEEDSDVDDDVDDEDYDEDDIDDEDEEGLEGFAASSPGEGGGTDMSNKFSKYKTCQDCTADGWGWCPIRRMCGGFANKKCSGSVTDLREDAEAEGMEVPEVVLPKRGEWTNSPQVTEAWNIVDHGSLEDLKEFLDENEEHAYLRSEDGRGPLFWAHEYGKQDMITLLLERGAESSSEDKFGNVPKDMEGKDERPPPPQEQLGEDIDEEEDEALAEEYDKEEEEGNDDDDDDEEEVARAAPPAGGTDMRSKFSSYQTCQACIADGWGWCPIRRMCGGFANNRCSDSETDKREDYDAAKDRLLKGGKGKKGKGKKKAKSKNARRTKAKAAEGDVLVLTDSNFDESVNGEELMLVEFYAPWCGHCKKLAPEYEKAATKLKKEGIKLAKVDATVEKASAQKFGVSGFPTLKVFRSGHASDYNGPREAKGIVRYMKAQSGPSTESLSGAEQVNAWAQKQDDVHVIAYVPEGSSLEKVYSAAADRLREKFSFAVVSEHSHVAGSSLELTLPEGATPFVAVFLAPDHEEEPRVLAFTEDHTASSVVKYVEANTMPLVGELNADSWKMYSTGSLPLFTIYLNPSRPLSKLVMKSVRELAKNMLGEITFTFADTSKEGTDYQMTKRFKLKATDHYGASITMPSPDGSKYSNTDLVFLGPKNEQNAKRVAKAVEGIKAWLKAVVAGTADRIVNSQPVIKPSYKQGMSFPVASNFEKVVKADKHALIEFYAPWCGHCKKLGPIWNKLGKKMKKFSEKVIIAKMDATANDAPKGYSVNGFPTLYYKAPNADPVPYQGGRELNDFVSFMKEKAEL